MKLIFDIETNGLYDQATVVWCISIKEIAVGSVSKIFINDSAPKKLRDASSGSIEDALSLLRSAKQVVGHNIIGYDLPVLKKILGFELPDSVAIRDTLLLSRLFDPDRTGGHSLAKWGERLGYPKGDHNDWSQLTREMMEYCKRDSSVTHKLYKHLQAEVKGQSWSESVELEHQVATIIAKQSVDGVLFDSELAVDTIAKLNGKIYDIDKDLLPLLPIEAIVSPTLITPFKATGDLTLRALNVFKGCSNFKIVGPFHKVEYKEVDLNSIHQVKRWLLSIGWVPTEFTATGGGKLTEDSFESLVDSYVGELFKVRVQCRHRIGQIQGWLDLLKESGRKDNRISADANTIGTPTGRFRHSKIVNVPAAAVYGKSHPKAGQLHWMTDLETLQSPLAGTEMRAMFKVSEGYVLVGHDASGLELRMLAHYMNDDEYTEVLLNGDIHSHNQELAGLHSRAFAKTFIYAFIYGAGDAKLGDIVSGGEAEGAALRARFLHENPKLNKLITRAKRTSRERGYLTGLDGRRIWLRRSDSGRILEHKALNTLLQCAGAVVMKKSMTLLDQWAREEGLVFKKVIDMHDEGQAEVLAAHAERYAELAVKSIVEAGKYFNLNLPLDAEAKIGMNWAETH